MEIIAAHVILAALLFFLVNWIGEHATDFGYASTTLFEEPTESLALNFFIRALAPSVFIVALSAIAVAVGREELRIDVYWVPIFYYMFRAIYILIMNMQQLVSWPRFFFHSSVGLAATWLAYQALIFPNRSLIPNLDTAGNELWLAIFAFLYAVANKISTPGGPGDTRRNAFIKRKFHSLKLSYSPIINNTLADDRLKLVAYSILIYEGYCRPPFIRALERLIFWKSECTTGVMQVASATALTDLESVKLGTEILSEYWQNHSEQDNYSRTHLTISNYNQDIDYINRVMEIMEILAKRAAPEFRPAYDSIWI